MAVQKAQQKVSRRTSSASKSKPPPHPLTRTDEDLSEALRSVNDPKRKPDPIGMEILAKRMKPSKESSRNSEK